MAYLRTIVNPADQVAVKRVINAPKRGIGDTTIAHVDRFSQRHGITFYEAVERAVEIDQLNSGAVRNLQEFLGVMNLLTERAVSGGVASAVQAVVEDTGYSQWLESERTIEALGRLENLRELQSVAAEFESANEGSVIGADDFDDLDNLRRLEIFLEQTSLVADIDEFDAGAGAVTLMTLHTAKGLEFPVVFVVGMEDGIFPHMRSLGEPSEMEEERRLAYVGITRAQDRLYLGVEPHAVGRDQLQPAEPVPQRDPVRTRRHGRQAHSEPEHGVCAHPHGVEFGHRGRRSGETRQVGHGNGPRSRRVRRARRSGRLLRRSRPQTPPPRLGPPRQSLRGGRVPWVPDHRHGGLGPTVRSLPQAEEFFELGDPCLDDVDPLRVTYLTVEPVDFARPETPTAGTPGTDALRLRLEEQTLGVRQLAPALAQLGLQLADFVHRCDSTFSRSSRHGVTNFSTPSSSRVCTTSS